MWQDIQVSFPVDGSEVWVRIGTNYGNPILAVFNLSTQIFVSSSNGLIMPAYMIARWKNQ